MICQVILWHSFSYQIFLSSTEKDHKNSEDVSVPKHKDNPTDTVRIVSITPNDGKVVENSVGFSLECKAEGTPTPNIAWKTGAVQYYLLYFQDMISLIVAQKWRY
jgi:hypothetical protein